MQQEVSSARSPILWFARVQRARIALAASLSLALVLVLGITVALARPAAPADAAHGDVIVQFGDSYLVARGITFTAPISGLRALELSGLEVITTSTAFGPAVCSIGG